MLDHEVEQEYLRVCERVSREERERIEKLRVQDAGSEAYAAALRAAIANAGGALCGSCSDAPAADLHTCPFAEEIGNDYETECDCCLDCETQCCMDI